jgi:Rrf2 family iron-sulfur cluster assembly transcriptional regulator
MQLTTKGRYAVTAMLDLSMHGHGKPINLAEISERQGISVSYLEQLFSKLRRESLVNSVKGPGGGYVLSRNAQDISVSEVIRAVDEKMDVTSCGGAGNCFQGEQCMTHQLWEDLSTQLRDFLQAISLGSLVERQVQKQAHLKNSGSHSDTQKVEIRDL